VRLKEAYGGGTGDRKILIKILLPPPPPPRPLFVGSMAANLLDRELIPIAREHAENTGTAG